MSAALPPLPARTARTIADRALGGLRVGVLPALLAMAMLRYFVPPAGKGIAGAVATLGRGHPLYFGVALFFLFSGLARYWSFHLGRSRAWRSSGESVAGPHPARRGREALGFIASVTALAAGAVLLRTRVVTAYEVSSESMLPTLQPADQVAGNKLAYRLGATPAPLRGDIVVFRSDAVAHGLAHASGSAAMPELLLKRVIGLPGDRIEMRGNVPVINGWPVPSCDAGEYLYVFGDVSGRGLHGRLRVEFLEDRTYLAVYAASPPFPEAYVVKPGEVFVLGDNRSNSVDSRAYDEGHGGGVSLAAVEARAERFLVGTHRNGDLDATRLFGPIDSVEAPLRLDGVQTEPLEDGVARCLKSRPASTRPPPVGG
jgi:signal peptidase I